MITNNPIYIFWIINNRMKSNIFTSTKHWKYTNNDQKAQEKFMLIEQQVRKTLPDSFYQRPLIHYQLMKQTHLYKLMKTIPKGVLHHIHYLCNDDQQFYRLHVINDPRIYLSKQMHSFQVGTVEQAKQKGWISMKEGIQKYGEKEWLNKIVHLTCFCPKQIQLMDYKSRQTWRLFQKKICSPLKIYFIKDIFQKYTKHMFLKYIKNGYDRIEIRCKCQQLNEYDMEGNFIQKHPIETCIRSLDQIISEINQQFPQFSFGAILVGFKGLSDQQNEQAFKAVLDTKWDKIVGLDYVQEQDMFDCLQRFDKIVENVLAEYPHLNHLKKVYHAGETTNHLTNNIDIAVKAGTVRIGHGINILQRTQFLPHCKNICFEKNPISNLLLGYKSDLRDCSAPILLGLGYPVSISPDDPGKFGLEDTTADYFISAASYNWTLRHFKLIAYHSINHAICEQKVKHKLIVSFQTAWNKWIADFITNQHINQSKFEYKPQDIFSMTKNWSYSEGQQAKDKLYSLFIDEVISKTSIGIYQANFIPYKKDIQSSTLYQILLKMPKGTLQSCHFITNHDNQFIKSCVLPYHNIYLNQYTKQLSNLTPNENQIHNWTSLQKLKALYDSQQDLAQYIYSLTSFTNQQLAFVIGHQVQFWKIYQKKYKNLITLLSSSDTFRKYTRHVLRKFALLNYQRVQFRIQPLKLVKYSQNGEKIAYYDYSHMINIIDEQLLEVKKEFRYFDIGFIILGNKQKNNSQNHQIFDYFAQTKWSKLIAFDLQQKIQDQCKPLSHYNQIIDQTIIKHEDLIISKIYQAGNSSNHSNVNIQSALNSGAIRITNGLNILQQVNLLSKCKNICFQVNPILNLCQGASKRKDFRIGIAPILLGLGFPVTISSDFCGIMGFKDTIFDFYLSAISYNWTLKHLKLSIIHSINYSCTTQGSRKLQIIRFEQMWQEWICNLHLTS